MYFYAYFWSFNPFEGAKLIVGIDGIDGKVFFGAQKRLHRNLHRLLSKTRRLRSNFGGMMMMQLSTEILREHYTHLLMSNSMGNFSVNSDNSVRRKWAVTYN